MILSALAELPKRRSKDDYYGGTFLREMVDDHAEVLIGTRNLSTAHERAAACRAVMRDDAVTLGHLTSQKIAMPEIACRRCERRGRLSGAGSSSNTTTCCRPS